MTYIRDNARAEAEAHGHCKQPLLKVIRSKCIDCCVGQQAEVRLCEAYDCNLWPYRMGKNPYSGHGGNMSTLSENSEKNDDF
jgi:hypothetical protein